MMGKVHVTSSFYVHQCCAFSTRADRTTALLNASLVTFENLMSIILPEMLAHNSMGSAVARPGPTSPRCRLTVDSGLATSKSVTTGPGQDWRRCRIWRYLMEISVRARSRQCGSKRCYGALWECSHSMCWIPISQDDRHYLHYVLSISKLVSSQLGFVGLNLTVT